MVRLLKLTPMLKTVDLPKTIEFYTRVLGFTVRSVWPEKDPCWCSLERGDVQVMFSTQAHESETPLMTGTLYFETNDVLGLHRWVSDQGAEVLWGPEIFHYGMHEFAIKDCNGYTLSFGQPTDQPPTCPAE